MTLRWITAAVLASTAVAVQAHHELSEYDSSKPMRIAGFIRQCQYEYPHGHLQLQTPDKLWLVVLAPPSRMTARGLPASALQPGVKAEVIGHVNRYKNEEMRAQRITIDGKTIALR